jgi:zinc/manganese transport system substrate-binding protein
MRLPLLLLLLTAASAGAGEPLSVCATIPDLGDLVRAVGGDDVRVMVFARGTEDPHFVEAKPSFAKALAAADLLVVVGMELEIGWVPPLQQQARNPRIATGGMGYLEACAAITPLEIPGGDFDRSHGDVHPGGNPHFLTDPVCGVRVARLICDRLARIAPDSAGRCEERWRAFAIRIAAALFGAEQARGIRPEQVVARAEQESREHRATGGWFGRLRPAAGAAVVADHDLWPYLAQRFGFTVIGFLEPKPGLAPTTRHLTDLVATMKGRNVKAILTVPYFDPRHARVVAEATGAGIVRLAHQVGATEDAGDYPAMIERNVRTLAEALAR